MKSFKLFAKLIFTDIKRLRSHILSIIISAVIIQAICIVAMYFISNKVYKEDSYEKVNIAYYLPEDDDKYYMNLGIGMLENLGSMKETSSILRVTSLDEGKSMLQNGEIACLIVIPENFFTKVMTGVNEPLTIMMKDTSSISSYISNEVFMSLAKDLGIAQAAIYSVDDVLAAHEFSDEQRAEANHAVNYVFLDRVLEKDNVIEKVKATAEGNYSLLQFYSSSALMISLLLISFIIIPFMHNYKQGMLLQLRVNRINKVHIMISNFISCFVAVYVAYLIGYVFLSLYFKTIHPIGLIFGMLPVMFISLIITIVSNICSNTFSGNISMLFITIIIAYISGGIIPKAMLPSIIGSIAKYTPGHMIINAFAFSIFG